MKADDFKRFTESLTRWAKNQPDISGLLLVGSYARGEAVTGSDIDLILFTSKVQSWLDRIEWLNEFGNVEKVEFEDWVGVKTQRAFFIDSFEVEFNFAYPSWASVDPIEQETYRIIAQGARVLFDPQGYLKRLIEALDRGA